jgi:hypothetical protein
LRDFAVRIDEVDEEQKTDSVFRSQLEDDGWVPPGRLERPHPAPEAGALSAELWGPVVSAEPSVPHARRQYQEKRLPPVLPCRHYLASLRSLVIAGTIEAEDIFSGLRWLGARYRATRQGLMRNTVDIDKGRLP